MTRRFFLRATAAVLGALVAAPCFDRRPVEPRPEPRPITLSAIDRLMREHYAPRLRAGFYAQTPLLIRLEGPDHA